MVYRHIFRKIFKLKIMKTNLITLKLTNTNWYSSIERADATFKSPTGKSITIRKIFFKWGLINERISQIIDGDVAHRDFDVEVTIEEMKTLFKMSQVKNYEQAEEFHIY